MESDDLGMYYWNRDFEKVREYLKVKHELNEQVRDMLTAEELADLKALFYIGRGSEQGEHYAQVLEHMKTLQSEPLSIDEIDSILSKTSLLENIIIGASLVGRPTLATRLREIRPLPDNADAPVLPEDTAQNDSEPPETTQPA
ncbi:hypothetical protein MAE02_06730 [Microvirga aerophila]|uniref:Uncharacterized protein n=2 Tax=Microvirga aerophila TaxID=670291 RepID=A0A512BM80_9HYPH|nr:hypothetical protein MAE02_06730 [Microvirga aerophila]